MVLHLLTAYVHRIQSAAATAIQSTWRQFRCVLSLRARKRAAAVVRRAWRSWRLVLAVRNRVYARRTIALRAVIRSQVCVSDH